MQSKVKQETSLDEVRARKGAGRLKSPELAAGGTADDMPDASQVGLPSDEVKLCECGCGKPAPIAKRTNRSKNSVKGMPLRFINGHGWKRKPKPDSAIDGHNAATSSSQKSSWKAQNKEAHRAHNVAYRARHRERLLLRDKAKKRELRLEVIAVYGGKCVCCGEDTPEFLTIDHVFGGGRKHREQIGSGFQFYRWLKKLGFPKDEYRLLCFNCNCAIGFFGCCPHQKNSNALLKEVEVA